MLDTKYKLEDLPRTFLYNETPYHLVIRAYDNIWSVSYEWSATDIYADIVMQAETMEKAIHLMCWKFENSDAFEHLREQNN